MFVAAGQLQGADGGVRGASKVAAEPPGYAGRTVVPLPIPYVLPPQRYKSGELLWKVDVDSSPGVQDSVGRERCDAGGTMYGYSQEVVQPYFDANN